MNDSMNLSNIMHILSKIANKIQNKQQEDWIILARRRYANSSLAKKGDNMSPLTEKEEGEIIEFWQKYHNKATSLFSIKQYSVYKNYLMCGGNLKHFIPDDFYYCYADTFFTNYHTTIKLDNKNFYDLYFSDVKMPETIIRRIDGIFMDKAYRQLSFQQSINACSHKENVIIKQALNSDGGKGIKFVEHCGSHLAELESELMNRDNYVVQCVIKQHPTLSAFNPQSVNTIRIMTLFYKGESNLSFSISYTYNS